MDRNLDIFYCAVMGSKLFTKFGMHIQLLQSQSRREGAAVGLLVHTQVIIHDFTCRNCANMLMMFVPFVPSLQWRTGKEK